MLHNGFKMTIYYLFNLINFKFKVDYLKQNFLIKQKKRSLIK